MYGEYDGHHTYYEGNEGMGYPTPSFVAFVCLFEFWFSFGNSICYDRLKKNAVKIVKLILGILTKRPPLYVTIARNQLKFR